MRSLFGPSKPQESALSSATGRGKPKPSAKTRPLTVNVVNSQAGLFPSQPAGKSDPDPSSAGLDVVLKLIVEQACLATGATGAAIALAGKDEMVCRATVGTTAPALGARFDIKRGITGACVNSQEIQRCEDALTDSRVDGATSRQLGVRSLLILPLVMQGTVAGVFELFSSRARAFSDRDEQTLIALSSRVLQKLERAAAAAVPAPAIVVPVAAPVPRPPVATASPAPAPVAPPPATIAPPPPDIVVANEPRSDAVPKNYFPVTSAENTQDSDPSTHFVQPQRDVIGIVLSVAIVLCALLLAAVVVIHPNLRSLKSGRAPATNTAAPPSSNDAATPDSAGGSSTNAQTSAADSQPSNDKAGTYSRSTSAASSASQRAEPPPPLPPGSLQVFEKGREVYRLLPNGGTSPSQPAPQPGSAQKPASVVELSSDAADRDVIDRVEPRYPQEAIALKIEGTVVLDVMISPNGLVQTIKPNTGDPLLAQAASEAVRQWRFRQQFVGGKPAAMHAQVRLSFMLPR